MPAATYNGTTLICSLPAPTGGKLTMDVQEDMYADWKVFVKGTGHFAPAAWDTTAGDPLPTGVLTGTYFFRNDLGWRIQATDEDQDVTFDGNLYPRDATLPMFLPRAARTQSFNTQLTANPRQVNAGFDATAVLQLAQIHGQVLRCVFVNTEAAMNGTGGYQQAPFNNWSDAVDYAEANKLQVMKLEADATLDRNLSNFEILGINLPEVDLNGFDCKNLIFRACSITGAQGIGDSPLLALTCNIGNITNFNGSMLTVSIVTGLGIADGSFCLINEIVPTVAGLPWTLDMQTGAAGSTVQLQNISGGVTIINVDHADDVLHLGFVQGAVTIAASCTAGNIVLTGDVAVTNNSAGTTVTINGKMHEIWQMNRLDGDNPRETDEDGTIRVGGKTVAAVTAGVTPNRTTTQTRT